MTSDTIIITVHKLKIIESSQSTLIDKTYTSQKSWLIWSDLILMLHQGQQDNFQIEDCSAELLLKYESLLQVPLEKLTSQNQQTDLVLRKGENCKDRI